MAKKKSEAQIKREVDKLLMHEARRAKYADRQYVDRPVAAYGLTSYRIRGRYGYIMIGAKDHEDAMREAARSTRDPKRADLEIFDDALGRYVKVFGSRDKRVPKNKKIKKLAWKEDPGSRVQAPLSFAGHYVISHRTDEHNVSYRPPGEHHHVGCYKTKAEARAAAERHAATGMSPLSTC
jgi:hypothetical protein